MKCLMQHLLMLVCMVIASVALPLYANRFLSEDRRLLVARVMAVVLSLTVVLWVAVRIALGDFDKTTDLPLDVCNLAALLMPFLMWKPSKRVHEILYFLVLVGTLQATLTPHLFNGFPNFTFFKYWIVHGGLIVYVVFITASFKFFPDRRSLLKAFVWLQGYAAAVFMANVLLGSNYFYVMRKPPTASLLDVLGPWPWYIFWCAKRWRLCCSSSSMPLSGSCADGRKDRKRAGRARQEKRPTFVHKRFN